MSGPTPDEQRVEAARPDELAGSCQALRVARRGDHGPGERPGHRVAVTASPRNAATTAGPSSNSLR